MSNLDMTLVAFNLLSTHAQTSGAGLAKDVMSETSLLQHYCCCYNLYFQTCTNHVPANYKLQVTTIFSWYHPNLMLVNIYHKPHGGLDEEI